MTNKERQAMYHAIQSGVMPEPFAIVDCAVKSGPVIDYTNTEVTKVVEFIEREMQMKPFDTKEIHEQ